MRALAAPQRTHTVAYRLPLVPPVREGPPWLAGTTWKPAGADGSHATSKRCAVAAAVPLRRCTAVALHL